MDILAQVIISQPSFSIGPSICISLPRVKLLLYNEFVSKFNRLALKAYGRLDVGGLVSWLDAADLS
jgi:hypothetical protein